MSADIKRQAIKEAISALGLIRPEAEDRMLALLRDQMDIHPRQISTGYRKEGEQLPKEEKKALGLRSNAFLPTGIRRPDRGRPRRTPDVS